MDKTAIDIPLMILVVNLEVKSMSVITNYNRILVKNSQEYIFHQTFQVLLTGLNLFVAY